MKSARAALICASGDNWRDAFLARFSGVLLVRAFLVAIP